MKTAKKVENRCWSWYDIASLASIFSIVLVAWCFSWSMWTVSSWSHPTSYLEVVKSDIIGMQAVLRAGADGHYLPVFQKLVPELGAPGVANWNDAPIVEEIPMFLTGILARFTGIFAALNIKILFGHLLAAVTFYGVARYYKCRIAWAWAGGLAFGLAPFIFAQSPHHSVVAYVWHIPLFLVVWEWVSTGSGVVPKSRRFWVMLAIAFITSLQNIYYTNIFCQLTLLGAVILYVRNRSLPALLSSLTAIAVVVAGFALMMLDTWLYRLEFGPNTGSVVREYKWLELYGLKIVDLFIPPVNHLSEGFRQIAVNYKTNSVLQDEGSYLGLAGLASLFLLAGSTAWAVISRKKEAVPREAWQVLWIIAVFTTGGINAIVGAAGFTMFRATQRYSIVILAIVLMYAVRKLSATPSLKGTVGVLAAIAASLIILWDQTPQAPSWNEQKQIAMDVASDRQFTEQMEKALPPGAMVFQLPIMEFPEAPAPGVPPYDHFRPYLYSTQLRFSFGTMKGRADTAWQKELVGKDLGAIVRILQEKGFAAIYINRNGFPDKAAALLDALEKLGWSQRIDSAKGDLACVLIFPGSRR